MPISVSKAVTLLVLLAEQVAGRCYFPDGSQAYDTPCSSATQQSTCCGTAHSCLGLESTYFLCQSTDGELSRGSCTDPSWKSVNCPDVCSTEDTGHTHGGNLVGRCPGSESRFYCMSPGYGVENCSTNWKLIIYASTPSVLTTIGILPSTTQSLSTSSQSPTTPASTSSSTGSAAGNSSPSFSTGATVGVTLGAVVAVAAVAAMLFVYIRRRKREPAARGPGPDVSESLHAPKVDLVIQGGTLHADQPHEEPLSQRSHELPILQTAVQELPAPPGVAGARR